jgi:hypothetical protein
MTSIFYFFLCAVISATTSYVLTRCYYDKVIDEWRILYDNCRREMDNKKEDEFYKKLKEAIDGKR